MKDNKGIGRKRDPRFVEELRQIAKKHNISIDIVNSVAISQFKLVKIAMSKKLNIRLFKLTMFYNRQRKNPDYLEMKKLEHES